MFRYFSATFICFLCFLSIVAQDKSQSATTNKQIILLPSEIQWEYLIVKLNPDNYQDYQSSNEPAPNLEPAAKKIDANRSFGFTSYETTYFSQLSESYTTQAALDSLGKSGWELVGVIPANSSDGNGSLNSRLIFKRQFDSERSQHETEQLNNKQNVTKTSSQTNKKPVEFVDLDLADAKAARLEVENKAAANLEQALKNIKEFSITNVKVKAYFQRNAEPITQAQIVVDGSQALLREGNKYRASEAQTYLRQVATEIFNKIGLRKPDTGNDFFLNYSNLNQNDSAPRIQIKISLSLFAAGESRTVAVGTLFGSRAEVAKQ